MEKTEKHPALPEKSEKKGEERACGFQAGALCPRCKQGVLDYNGMLMLECPVCGLTNGYGFT
jgi:hypothetical protein